MAYHTIYEKGPFTKEQIGGKGFGLWSMQKMGINVPPALIIPITSCKAYQVSPQSVMAGIASTLGDIEKFFTDKLGHMPLLAVRSGGADSMPGMMDTILNVGLTPDNILEWKDRLGMVCIEDCVERFRIMYGKVVLGDASAMLPSSKMQLPSLHAQLLGSIEAVFKSWNNPRAKEYRKLHGISEQGGTAIVIQAMVFGNFNEKSATGVLFSRNPDTGGSLPVVEWLPMAQGEDLVDGSHTPQSFAEMMNWNPELTADVVKLGQKLEKHFTDAQDVEFTIQDGNLYLLQTRPLKRSGRAALKIALDLEHEGMITEAEMLTRVTRRDFYLSHLPVLDSTFKTKPFATGLGSGGVVIGKPVFSAKDAIDCKEPCILVTDETNPDDIAGMAAAVGVLTMRGGTTCHAAVVSRGMNKTCVVGLGKSLSDFANVETISLDGGTGKVWLKKVPVVSGDSKLADSFLSRLAKNFGNVIPVDFTLPKCPKIMLDATEEIATNNIEALKETIKQHSDNGREVVLLKSTCADPMAEAFYMLLGSYIPSEGIGHPVVEEVTTLEQAIDAEGAILLAKPEPRMNKLANLKAAAGHKVYSWEKTPHMERVVTKAQLISLLP